MSNKFKYHSSEPPEPFDIQSEIAELHYKIGTLTDKIDALDDIESRIIETEVANIERDNHVTTVLWECQQSFKQLHNGHVYIQLMLALIIGCVLRLIWS